MLCATQLISELQLEPHSEGGFFRRTYTSPSLADNYQANASCIYYLLSVDQPIGYLHRNKSDIVHFWHAGNSIDYHLLNEQGLYHQHTLGPNLSGGEQLQLIVPGGTWKASTLKTDDFSHNERQKSEFNHSDFGLISETVIPEFKYAEREIATLATLKDHAPKQYKDLKYLLA